MSAMSSEQGPERLPGIEDHAHARAVLLPALPPDGEPAHAYLFHGPTGSGKEAVARGFAGALLTDGARTPETVAVRVARDAHPDLTWVRPSGASEVLVGDIEGPVVAAATHTPFESARRVFVIEAAGTMNDQAANRLLKTLEEPASFVHVILLAEHREDVLATIASRCQQVRFDPLSGAVVRERLEREGDEPIEAARAAACAELAGGDLRLARRLAGEEGAGLREWAERFVGDALGGRTEERSWTWLLEAAKAAAGEAGAGAGERLKAQAELLPSKERRKYEREGADAVRRSERRARVATLDLGLRLAEQWLRDGWCLAVGAPELALAVDRREKLAECAAGRSAASLMAAVELVGETRLALALNVGEELALEALAYRLAALPS